MVELDLLEQDGLRSGASLDVQQARGHVIGAPIGFCGHPVQQRRCAGPAGAELAERALQALGAEQLSRDPGIGDAIGVEADQ